MRAYDNLPDIYAPPPQAMQESLRSHGVGDSVRVLWDKLLKRWEVQTFGATTKRWYFTFYWARYGKDGSVTPRDLPWTCAPILEWLAHIDEARFGRGPEKNRLLALREMDDARRARVDHLRGMRREMMRTLVVDLARHGTNQKQVFGPGGHRSRKNLGTGSREYVEAVEAYRKAEKE